MKTSRVSAALLLAAGLSLSPPSAAAVNAYLQLGDVKGESKDPAHHDWIEVLSTNFAGAPAGRSAENVNHGSFHIVKLVDKSSPALSMAASSRKPFPRATIEARGSRWVLPNVIVSSVLPHVSGGGEEAPTETVTFEYGALEIAYEHQTTRTPTPSKSPLSAAEVAPAALKAAVSAPKITGASASAPFTGLGVTLTITSTGPCSTALVDWGDSPLGGEGHALTGTLTQLPTHVYATAGVKTIKVGGRDASYWKSGPQKGASRVGDCTGEAPLVSVTLRSATAAAPMIR